MPSDPQTCSHHRPLSLPPRYTQLYHTYRLAVNGAHFGPGAATATGAPLYQWHAPPPPAPGTGIAACAGPPLLRFLAAPRLPPELGKYLAPQQQH